MRKINILFYIHKYLITRGLSDILKEINGNINLKNFHSLEEAKSFIIDNRLDLLIVENINTERLFTPNIIQNLGHTKVIIIGKSEINHLNDLYDYEFIPKNISKEQVYKKFNDLLNYDKIEYNEEDILSEREKEIVKLIALGFSNKEIADKLFLSIHTITTHRKNISKKLGIKTISGITIYAVLNGIITINGKK